MEESKLHRIIKALLAKAQSTDSKEESDAFMAKAYEMMEEHQISAFSLGEDPIGVTDGVTGQPGMASYKPQVQTALAKLYGARPVIHYTEGNRWIVKLFGPESARITTELMTPFVWSQICVQGKAWGIDHGRDSQAGTREVAKAFISRINAEVGRRSREARREGTSHSLVVVDATKAFIATIYPNLGKVARKTKKISMNAMERAAGISTHQQVSGNQPLALR